MKPPKCFYCDVELLPMHQKDSARRSHPRAETVEHIVPQSKIRLAGHGGAGWRIRNKVQACFACNNRKGGMWPLDWLVIMPDAGVIRLCNRLLELGCPQVDISAALARRAA